ncbi:MAG TPA: TonB-dependent receptor [Rhizomicrobium sp.]|nr:TonB-dependent receptor [Rhizomicrobium sp.]
MVGSNIETVVVTARKRDERLLDVPVSASAMDGAALDRYATTDLTSLGTQMPSLQVDQASSGNRAIITVRGISSTSGDAGIEQEVTVNVDGVPISRGSVIQDAFFDEDSIAVLKGPQALYFGKNSPAGVIAITSVDPADHFEGYARAGFEAETQQLFGEAAVSLPITDDFGARLAVRASDMFGGYIHNVAGPITDPAALPANLVAMGLTLPGAPDSQSPQNKEIAGRLTLKYAPDGRFDATFKVLVSDFRDAGITGNAVFFHCADGFSRPQVLDYGGSNTYKQDPYGSCSPGNGQSAVGTVPAFFADHYPGSHGTIPYDHFPTYISSLVMNYRVTPDVVLTSTTGFFNVGETSFGTLDYTTLAEATGRNNDFNSALNEELRVVTAFDGPLNFTGGLFYEQTRRAFLQNTMLGYLGIDPATGLSTFSASHDNFTGNTLSAYGELSWKIAPNLELAGGARYTAEHKGGTAENTYVFPGKGAAYLPVGQVLTPNLAEHNVSPQATLTWHVTPDVMLYAAYKTGFKSGGIQTPTRYSKIANSENIVFNQETVTGGEVGLKFQQMDGMLTGDITGYHYSYKGLQLTAYDVSSATFFTQNAGSAQDDGLEANVNYQVMPGLLLRSTVNYNSAKYTDFPDAQCFTGQTVAEGCVAGLQNLSGTPLPRAPHWTGDVGVNYDTSLTGDWMIGATADLRFSSKYQASGNYSPWGFQNSFQTFNASLRVYDDQWEAALIGTNLSNTIYAVLKQDQVLGPRGDINGFIGQTRQITMQITRRF